LIQRLLGAAGEDDPAFGDGRLEPEKMRGDGGGIFLRPGSLVVKASRTSDSCTLLTW